MRYQENLRETGGPHALEQKVRRAGHHPRLLRCPAGGDWCLCPMPTRIPLVLPFQRLRSQRPASRLLPATAATTAAGLGGETVQLGVPELRFGLRWVSRLRAPLQPSVQSLHQRLVSRRRPGTVRLPAVCCPVLWPVERACALLLPLPRRPGGLPRPGVVSCQAPSPLPFWP